MAELRVPWATLCKIIAAAALVWLWLRLWQLVMLVLVAIIIAIGLAPAARWLEQRRFPRWAAAAVVTLAVLAVIVGFVALTWTSLSDQAKNLSGQIQSLEQEVLRRAPKPILELIDQAGAKPDASMIGPYLTRLGSSALSAVSVFVLAFILVFYFLIEGEVTYEWVRHRVPQRHRARFDQTAREAHEVAFGFVVGNVVTSACAGIYVYAVLSVLGVPAAMVLAIVAFITDFIPVLGFFLSCAPAILMAATVSPTLAIAMIPIYMFYDFLENYFIGPRVYGDRLELSNIAVLLAFAAGAQLAGVIGALLALPVAAIFPTIDRIWLRRARNSQRETDDA